MAVTQDAPMTVVGKATPRVDGPLKVSGLEGKLKATAINGKVDLQEMGGGERVARRAGAGPAAGVGHPGGEALVVCLNRHVDQLAQLRGELLAQLGLLALLSREGGGQTDDHSLGALGCDQLGDRLRIRRLDGSERARERPARVRDRTAAPGRAVIEREHPQEAIG